MELLVLFVTPAETKLLRHQAHDAGDRLHGDGELDDWLRGLSADAQDDAARCAIKVENGNSIEIQ